MIPFSPVGMTPGELADRCVEARRSFYSWGSIARRAKRWVNIRNPYVLVNYLVINAMHQRDIDGRNGLPMGDRNWHGRLIRSATAPEDSKLTAIRH